MIFSFDQLPKAAIHFSLEKTDIFCFFHSENAIIVPRNRWVIAVAATLRAKKNVLLLESPRELAPIINESQRWQVGEDYLWIAPRGLSVLIKAAGENSDSYTAIKFQLSNSK